MKTTNLGLKKKCLFVFNAATAWPCPVLHAVHVLDPHQTKHSCSDSAFILRLGLAWRYLYIYVLQKTFCTKPRETSRAWRFPIITGPCMFT